MVMELGPRVAVIPGAVNVGVLRAAENRIILVDTGLNETSGKKALRAAREELGGEVVAILTTHAHADHFGANALIVKRTGARVYAPEFDEAVLRYPLLMPIFLFAGADPLDTMRGKFLLAEPSPVDEVIRPGRIEVEGIEIEVISLAGHSVNQVGYVVDDVFFCADVVLPESVLAKYKIPYLHSVTNHLAALDTAEVTPHKVAVPGHGEIGVDLNRLVKINRDLILEIGGRVVELCSEWTTAEELLTALLRQYEAAVQDAPSFYLLQPTAFAYLSHLQRTGRIEHDVRDGRSLWRAI